MDTDSATMVICNTDVYSGGSATSCDDDCSRDHTVAAMMITITAITSIVIAGAGDSTNYHNAMSVSANLRGGFPTCYLRFK